jgi:hypothetical protein
MTQYLPLNDFRTLNGSRLSEINTEPKGHSVFANPSLGATFRYYDSDNLTDSKQWIWEGYKSNDSNRD